MFTYRMLESSGSVTRIPRYFRHRKIESGYSPVLVICAVVSSVVNYNSEVYCRVRGAAAPCVVWQPAYLRNFDFSFPKRAELFFFIDLSYTRTRLRIRGWRKWFANERETFIPFIPSFISTFSRRTGGVGRCYRCIGHSYARARETLAHYTKLIVNAG